MGGKGRPPLALARPMLREGVRLFSAIIFQLAPLATAVPVSTCEYALYIGLMFRRGLVLVPSAACIE